MSAEPARAGPEWLALREPVDAAARSSELAEEVRALLAGRSRTVVHDLGCGTGSMARWLARRLDGPQHWIMYERDEELLAQVTAAPPVSADGSPVAVELRQRDITRLDGDELADASLITASALLDMMTADELRRLVASSSAAGCPVLVALSVTGRVALEPADPFDAVVADAFNDHQRRATPLGRLLGPDAVGAAVDGFTRLGRDVTVRDSPWRLGPEQAPLAEKWFVGWLLAACEQRPELNAAAPAYARRRLGEAAAGRLAVTVHHLDLLVRPRRATTRTGDLTGWNVPTSPDDGDRTSDGT